MITSDHRVRTIRTPMSTDPAATTGTGAAVDRDLRPDRHQDLRRPRHGPRKGHLGAVVVGSLAVGLLAAVALAAAPFVPVQMHVLTGVVLLGFALGWAVLAVLSVRLTDRPQRWAAAPAGVLALAGLVSLLPPGSLLPEVFGWVWPPLLLGVVLWSVVRVHRQLRSRTRRWLVQPLLVVLALSAIGGGYQTVRESVDARAHPPPGRLVDVGGHRLHLQCSGTGTPTVVLEPGLGETSSVMAWIAQAVGSDSQVCVYDRAGRGWSDPVDGPQDALDTATDLHTLLDRAQVPGPYVLAGHSFGGLYVLTFAAAYPDQVAGLVLLDSTAPRADAAPPPEAGSYDLVGRVTTLLAATADLGVAHLLPDPYDSLPARSRDEARASASTARTVNSYLDEWREGGPSIRQAAALEDVDGKPLVVVTAGRGHDAAFRAAQEKLTALSTHSRHRVVPDATHASLVLEQAHAAAAGRAVREVVTAVRTGAALPPS